MDKKSYFQELLGGVSTVFTARENRKAQESQSKAQTAQAKIAELAQNKMVMIGAGVLAFGLLLLLVSRKK